MLRTCNCFKYYRLLSSIHILFGELSDPDSHLI